MRLLVRGELERSTAWELTAAAIRADEHLPKQLTLDLSGVTFIDLAGLRAISDVARRSRKRHRTFAVANPSEPVARLLKLTSLDQSVQVVNDGPGRVARG